VTARATCPGRAPRSVRHKGFEFPNDRRRQYFDVTVSHPGVELPGAASITFRGQLHRLLPGDPAIFPPR
jgi:hypothetical protein